MSDTLNDIDDDSLKTFEKLARKAVKSLSPVKKLLERAPVIGNALKGLNLGNEIIDFQNAVNEFDETKKTALKDGVLSSSERKQLSILKDKVVSNAADIGDSLPVVGLPISITTDAVRIMGKIRQYNNENACTTKTEDLTGCTAVSRQDIARQDAMKFPENSGRGKFSAVR